MRSTGGQCENRRQSAPAIAVKLRRSFAPETIACLKPSPTESDLLEAEEQRLPQRRKEARRVRRRAASWPFNNGSAA